MPSLNAIDTQNGPKRSRSQGIRVGLHGSDDGQWAADADDDDAVVNLFTFYLTLRTYLLTHHQLQIWIRLSSREDRVSVAPFSGVLDE